MQKKRLEVGMKNGKWTNVLGITGQVHHGDNTFTIEGESNGKENGNCWSLSYHNPLFCVYSICAFVYPRWETGLKKENSYQEILGYRAG